MSLHFGPSFAMLSQPRTRRVCISAQMRGPVTLRGYWQTGCTKMAIRRQNIEIAQHGDVDVQIDMLDQAGNPLDISGFQSLTWIIADSVRGAILLTKTSGGGGIALPSATRGVVALTSAETGALPARRLYHELRGVNSGNEAQTMVAGYVYVEDTRIADT